MPAQTSKRPRRRGVVLVYVTLAMVLFLSLVSLSVDLGHVRLVKVELQAAADAAALQAGNNLSSGSSATRTAAKNASKLNYADGTSVVLTNADIEFGTWNTATSMFTPQGSWSSSATAVRISARRTAATSNAVSLMFASVIGIKSEDVVAQSVAYVVPASTQNITIPSTSDPWLAGMPSGSTASYDDTAPAESPLQVPLTLTPGSYITLNNIAGFVNHGGGSNDYNGDGDSSGIYSHGADSPGGPTPAAENGIADIVSPIDAIIGVFIGPSQPGSTAPSRRDYTTQASRDLSTYSDIQLQQPFFIGDGQTSGGVQQQFLVPAGATRLFIGPMDGHEWKNNNGAFTATVSVGAVVTLVQ